MNAQSTKKILFNKSTVSTASNLVTSKVLHQPSLHAGLFSGQESITQKKLIRERYSIQSIQSHLKSCMLREQDRNNCCDDKMAHVLVPLCNVYKSQKIKANKDTWNAGTQRRDACNITHYFRRRTTIMFRYVTLRETQASFYLLSNFFLLVAQSQSGAI